VGKSTPTIWFTSAIFKELPKVNNHPYRRKFGQSGHPAALAKLSKTVTGDQKYKQVQNEGYYRSQLNSLQTRTKTFQLDESLTKDLHKRYFLLPFDFFLLLLSKREPA
jgi:hypothetical protein